MTGERGGEEGKRITCDALAFFSRFLHRAWLKEEESRWRKKRRKSPHKTRICTRLVLETLNCASEGVEKMVWGHLDFTVGVSESSLRLKK